MTNTSTPDIDITSGAIAMTYDPAAFKPPHKAPDVARESDGRHQLVGYLGWKTILERLARRSA